MSGTLSAKPLPAPNKSRSKWLWILGAWFILVAGISAGVWTWWNSPLISPLSEGSSFRFFGLLPPATTTRSAIVYGYLPYWNVAGVELQPELTHLSYFGLTIGSDGSLLTRDADGNTEPGYRWLQSDQLATLFREARNNNQQVELTVVQFDNDDISAFLTNPNAHQTFLTSLDSALLAYEFSGVNLDIEYSGEVTPQLQQAMTEFVKKVNAHLDQKYRGVTLSMAMYASAAERPTLWQVAALAEHLDYIVIMAYDFHQRSSSQAGPVAPLFGGQELWSSDISQHLQAFLKIVPAEKIILGVPFYGYEWQTTSANAQALTVPRTGATASYKRVQEVLAQGQVLGVTQNWQEDALSPYLTYQSQGKTYLIYYEDERSLSYKLDFANQLELAGIAIWALGYEGNSRVLWDTIHSHLTSK